MAGHSGITPDAEYEVIVTGDGKHFVATCKGYPVFAQGEDRKSVV